MLDEGLDAWWSVDDVNESSLVSSFSKELGFRAGYPTMYRSVDPSSTLCPNQRPQMNLNVCPRNYKTFIKIFHLKDEFDNSFRKILIHSLMSYHTCVLVTKNNMINQPVWTTSIIIMTKPQASNDSNIGWPETKMRNTTRNIKIWGIPMRPNHMEPNVCRCCASCSCLVWRKYKNLKKVIQHKKFK